jgi:RNA polymerase sigma-70 factor (ECF subfamily)
MMVDTTSIEDEALIERATRRDRDAFGRLYERYFDRVYTYLYYRTRSDADAADLAAQAFLNAWKAIDRYQPTGAPLLAWLLRIAHNLVTDHHRRRRDAVTLDFDIMDNRSESDPAALTEQVMTKEALHRAIRRLPEEQQQVLLLRFVQGLGHAEVANLIGKSEGAVRTIQYRALIGLRLKLEAASA